MKTLLLLAAWAVAVSGPVRAIDLRARSESGTKQFIVYSDDVRLRQRVASFAEGVKSDVMQMLGESDFWKAPIVITLERATTIERGEPSARMRLAETQPGFKIEIQVRIGEDPTTVNLHKVLLRAVLLEYSYRQAGIRAGEAIVEPPWWIVEGLYAMAQQREHGTESALFRQLVATNKLPPIASFLAAKPDELGSAALVVDGALAMSLLDLLAAQPGGRADLARLVRDWPRSDGDPVSLVARNFPALGAGQNLQKWWTLSLARFAAADRYQGLTAEETEQALAPLLQLEIEINKAGEKKTFAVAEFPEFLKLPKSKEVLNNRYAEIVSLGTRANVLYRAVLADYQEVFSRLTRGKARGVRERLAKAEDYRQFVRQRSAQIADYLNWFEATQMPSQSGVFDSYLKTAAELSEQDRRRRGPVAQYLDGLELEY